MNMKRLLTLVAFFATLQASAQQVNPVPDYVFANRMSAGRNTVTDTAAYFSIGPRYGATRGMMPPMVVDTASFSANKRNGLLIFSVQKNKFLYWDSVGVKWAEMAGTAGTALTSADTAALLSTRAWRQKGIDSLAAIRIAGGGTNNYVPKFTAASTIGNSLLFDNGSNVGIGTTSPSLENSAAAREFTITQSGLSPANLAVLNLQGDRTGDGTVVSRVGSINFWQGSRNIARINGSRENIDSSGTLSFLTSSAGSALTSRLWIHSNGRIGVNTTTDAGYQFDINGTLRTVNGTVFASTSGNVAIGATTADSKLHVESSTPTITIKNPIVASTDENTADNISAGLITFGAYGSFQIVGSIESKYATNASFGRRASMIFSTRNPTSLSEGMRLSYDKELLIADTVDAGDYKLQVKGNIYNTGSITTGAPSGGSIKPWKIGEAATVSPTSPNRTIRVEIDGTVYYLHAKTTND